VPVDDRMGFAETALTEPWACVEAAYTQRRRLAPRPGGRTWIVARSGDTRSYTFGQALRDAAEVTVTDASDDLVSAIRDAIGTDTRMTGAAIDEAVAAGPYDDVIAIGRLDPDVIDRAMRIVRIGPEPGALETLARSLTDGRGADDVVITAPAAAAVASGAAAMAPDGMLVLFAGVPVGTRVALDLSPIFLGGAQYTGTSGSRIVDQARVVAKTLDAELAPRRALAAV